MKKIVLAAGALAAVGGVPNHGFAQDAGALEEVIVVGRSYRTTETSGATFVPTPILNLPQSVQVVTQQLIEDQRPLTLSDALKNVSGFSSLRNSGEIFRAFNVRGFNLIDLTVDGMRQTYGLDAQPDGLANVERIEVLKGPTGALYGRGGMGGTVNIDTKDPLPTRRFVGSFSTGYGGLIQPTADLTGPLNASASVRGRLVADYEKRDTPIDYVGVERFQIAPSLAVDLGQRTTVTLKADYLERHGLRFVALPAYGTVLGLDDLRVPFNLYVGEPGVGKAKTTYLTATARLQHQFSDTWSLSLGGRYSHNTFDQPSANLSTLRPDNRTLNRVYRRFDSSTEEWASSGYVTGAFQTGSISHNLVLGADWAHFETPSKLIGGGLAPINIADPVYGVPVTNTFILGDTTDILGSLGTFAQDQIDLTSSLRVLVGIRYDHLDKDRINNVTTVATQRNDAAWSPRLGVSYTIADGVALFASYGTGLEATPDGGSNRLGIPFRAQTGKQYEGGIKLDLSESLSATVAAYDLTRDGVLVADGTGFSTQAGQQKSSGIELDTAWQAGNGISVIANYTYMNARVTRDTTIPVGNSLANDPKHQARLWGKYALPENAWGRFAVSAGVTYQSEQQANIQNTYKIPSSVVADLGLFYERAPFGVQLNIVNLFDRKYITRGALGNVGVIPGDPRRVILTLKTVL